MTLKAELLFVNSQRYGALYYHNVYSFYDEPLIFTALNDFGQLFFCYSLGCDDLYDQWLITPISEQNANKLEQKSIPIVKAIQQKLKSKILLLKIDLESSELIEELKLARNLPYLLPAPTVYIRENINYDKTRKHSHRIRIAKKNSSPIVSELLNEVSEAFSVFCRNYLNKFDVLTKFYPYDALTGSFVYRVKADNLEQLRTKGYEILSKVSNKQDFLEALDNKEIDLRLVKGLFEILLSNNLDIQLIDEESTQSVLNISADYVKDLIAEVDNRLGLYIDSSMVPQADNLETLKRYLILLNQDGFVTQESLGIDKRQVDYYRDASRLLSLIHDYSKLTPLGYRAITAEEDVEYVGIIKRQFEEMECGHIWMANQNVTSILDIDENSAEDFLVNNCNGLSESTSKRRAQTLKSWVKKFKQYA